MESNERLKIRYDKRQACCLSLVMMFVFIFTMINHGNASSTHCPNGDSETIRAKKSNINDRTTMKHKWEWNMNGNVCNITRISRRELHDTFGPGGLPSLYHEPVVIYNDRASPMYDDQRRGRDHFRHLTQPDVILDDTFPPHFNVTLTSSNSQSEHRRTMTLMDYIYYQRTTEVLPTSWSNETWYLFGETYTDEWRSHLMRHYILPPCQSCRAETVSLSFGIGGVGSGVQWHTHGPGFSESIHGRKHWVLYPPGLEAGWRVKDFNKDRTSRHWMEEVYTGMAKEERPWECTVHPGEMVYFPNEWHHATINLDPYTVFVSSFTWEWD